jgi:hypothetical protein
MSRTFALLVLFALAAPLLPAGAAEIPQGPWSFDVECSKIKPVSMKVGINKWHTWWYVVLDVANKTGEERAYNVIAKVATDTARRARPVMNPAVRKEIERQEGTSLTNILVPGKLARGASLKGVLILDKVDRLADRIYIRLQGLASYLYKRGHKVYKEIREYRVEMIRRGDEFHVHRNPVHRKWPRWVVVSSEKIQG